MRTLIAFLMIAAVAGLGYFGYLQFTNVALGQSTGLLTTASSTADTGAAGAQVLLFLKKLQAIQLDGASLFNDPVFQSLQDWTVPISQEPVGRPNPFLPASAAPQTQNAQVPVPQLGQ